MQLYDNKYTFIKDLGSGGFRTRQRASRSDARRGRPRARTSTRCDPCLGMDQLQLSRRTTLVPRRAICRRDSPHERSIECRRRRRELHGAAVYCWLAGVCRRSLWRCAVNQHLKVRTARHALDCFGRFRIGWQRIQ